MPVETRAPLGLGIGEGPEPVPRQKLRGVPGNPPCPPVLRTVAQGCVPDPIHCSYAFSRAKRMLLLCYAGGDWVKRATRADRVRRVHTAQAQERVRARAPKAGAARRRPRRRDAAVRGGRRHACVGRCPWNWKMHWNCVGGDELIQNWEMSLKLYWMGTYSLCWVGGGAGAVHRPRADARRRAARVRDACLEVLDLKVEVLHLRWASWTGWAGWARAAGRAGRPVAPLSSPLVGEDHFDRFNRLRHAVGPPARAGKLSSYSSSVCFVLCTPLP
eukprot:gene8726-biopygen3746